MARNRDDTVSPFFRNEEGEIQYNNKCLHCINDCKQSYKATIMQCPKYKDRQKTKE